MELIKLSESTHDAPSRSINAQAGHWLRVGMLAELHSTLTYGESCQ
ncbi:MAG: hypothetical protein VB142_08260 [Burkholderia sp.]